jgi:hypothetical protein
MAIYLVTYNPLCSNLKGRKAALKYDLPPFIDGSTRREPDLELKFPSISSLCRGRNFAPRLNEGDSVIYITRKGNYGSKHYKLTTILEVIKEFENHEKAASWYKDNDKRIPSNCMVEGNNPIDTAKTIVRYDTAESTYKQRAKDYSKFFACKSLETPNLINPPILDKKIMNSIFTKGLPSTQTPSDCISKEQLEELKKLLKDSNV